MESFACYLMLLSSPPLTDLEFLPPRIVCTRFRQMNCCLASVLVKERMVRPHLGWELTAAIGHCEFSEEVWNKLEDAQREWDSVACRRLALRNVRELLGPERYYAGRVPLVGWWRKVD